MLGRRWLAQYTHPLSASRKDAVSIVETYQYPDPEDTFSREPFLVKFSIPGSGETPPRPPPPRPHRLRPFQAPPHF